MQHSGRPLMDIMDNGFVSKVLLEVVNSNLSASSRELDRDCGVSKATFIHNLLSLVICFKEDESWGR